MLTADRQIVRVSTDDDLTGCLMSAPVVYPKIDDIVEEDVGEKRANAGSLRRPDLHRFPSAALEDAGLEPPLDQAEDSRVSDPMPSIRTSHPWSTESKKVRMSRSSTQFTRCVITALSRAAKAE